LLAGCMHPPPLKAVPLIRVQGVERRENEPVARPRWISLLSRH